MAVYDPDIVTSLLTKLQSPLNASFMQIQLYALAGGAVQTSATLAAAPTGKSNYFLGGNIQGVHLGAASASINEVSISSSAVNNIIVGFLDMGTTASPILGSQQIGAFMFNPPINLGSAQSTLSLYIQYATTIGNIYANVLISIF
jgi:hypothetical protein